MTSPDTISGPRRDWRDFSVGASQTSASERASGATLSPFAADVITSQLNQQDSAVERQQYHANPQSPQLENPDEEEAREGGESVATRRPYKRTDRAVILREFSTAYQQEVVRYASQQSPPLTEEEMDRLMRALENPDDPDIDEETQQLAEQLGQQAEQTIRQQFHLPPTWTPKKHFTKRLDPNNRIWRRIYS